MVTARVTAAKRAEPCARLIPAPELTSGLGLYLGPSSAGTTGQLGRIQHQTICQFLELSLKISSFEPTSILSTADG